jgi:hypothetical protein
MVMMWQMWTAFGIALGFVADLAFFYVPDRSGIVGLNWRLMLGSVSYITLYNYLGLIITLHQAGIPAFVVMAQVYFCPESPRWYMAKGRYPEAYNSLARLRNHPLQAARDLYCMSSSDYLCGSWFNETNLDIHVLLEAEKEAEKAHKSQWKLFELFTVPRNRHAALGSFIVMFM